MQTETEAVDAALDLVAFQAEVLRASIGWPRSGPLGMSFTASGQKYVVDTNVLIDVLRSAAEREATVGRLLGGLTARGKPLPSRSFVNELLIGVSCRERGLTVVTRDRDVHRVRRLVSGLRVEALYPARGAPRRAHNTELKPAKGAARLRGLTPGR